MNLDVLDMTNWLTSTFQSVRNKSFDTFELVKKDLVDFTTTVKNDTENVLNQIKSQPVVSKLTHMTKFDSEKSVLTSTSFDRIQIDFDEFLNERSRLQNDDSTYLIDPIPIESYEYWREQNEFNVENMKNEIAQLLIDAPHIRSIYARVVPACTTHSDFWSRYYFRLHQLNEEEIRRMNLIKRAEEICNKQNSNDWDEADEELPQETTNTTKSNNTSEEVIHQRKESDTASGDSWERDFDENDLDNTSKIDLILSENSASTVTIMKQTENEFDDEWESWS